jgi:hypothetical protein
MMIVILLSEILMNINTQQFNFTETGGEASRRYTWLSKRHRSINQNDTEQKDNQQNSIMSCDIKQNNK